MKKKKIHLRNPLSHNLPICCSAAHSEHWKFGSESEVTCGNCLRAINSNHKEHTVKSEADAGRIFLSVCKSKNIITPTVIEYGWAGKNAVYELSKGTGIISRVIYGVTFVAKRNGEWMLAHEYGRCVASIKAARGVIAKAREFFGLLGG